LGISVCQRRRARQLAYGNGVLWALGNGLVSSWLVIYLLMDLGATSVGLGLSLIRAAPQLAGLLRLGAPAMIGRLADRKRFCIGAYLLSAAVLAGVPLVAAGHWLPSPDAAKLVLVTLWCTYHLLEYLGTVALWSWFADLVPLRIRGRFIGIRERWMLSGQVVGMLGCALFNYLWKAKLPGAPVWLGYAIPAGLGVLLLAAAVIPLLQMPAAAGRTAPVRSPAWSEILAPLRNPRFLRWLAFGCWFSLFNGLFLPAQDSFLRVLNLGLWVPLVLTPALRCGQLALGPTTGKAADRLGNRPVIAVSLAIVAAGPLFLFLATPEGRWWILGCWALWIAYVGINVGQPNLTLKLAPPQSSAAYVAAFQAITGLCMAASTIAGGQLYDLFGRRLFTLPILGASLDFHHTAFLLAWVTRSLGVLVLMLVVVEPNQGGRGKPEWG